LSTSHSLPQSAARVLALVEIQHNPDEVYDEFTFDGRELGLPDDEYVTVKYYRRKRDAVTWPPLQQMAVME